MEKRSRFLVLVEGKLGCRRGDFLYEDAGISAGSVVGILAGGGEVFGFCGGVAPFLLDEIIGLGREGKNPFHAALACLVFYEMDEFAPVALIFVIFAHMEAGEFPTFLFRVGVESHASHGVPVDFHDPVVLDAFEDFVAGAPDQFLVFDGLADERKDGADIFFENAADLLVFVGIDHGADALVAEDFGQESFVDGAVQEVDAGHAEAAGAGGVRKFRREAGGDLLFVFFKKLLGFVDGEVVGEGGGGEIRGGFHVNHLGGAEGFRHFDRDGIGVHPECMPFSIKA